MNSLYKAKSIEDIIAIIEPSILAKIPKDKLNDIAENILMFERYFRNEIFVTPNSLKATRIFSLTLDKIMQIDYEGVSYKL
jgi:signal-transduction protein with cAMP-binding, CBS, and nucleotidyltransferase domain